MRFFSFSLLIGGGALLAHLYLYARLVRRLVPAGRGRHAAAAVLAVVTVLLFFRSTIRDFGYPVARIYEVFAFGWIATALAVLLAVVCGDLLTLGVRLVGTLIDLRADRHRAPTAASLVEPTPQADPPEIEVVAGLEQSPPPSSTPMARPTRRAVLQAIPWGALAGGGALASYGTYRAFTAPELTRIVVPMARLPRTLEGLRIVQLTDVHVGSFIGRGFIDMLVEATNAARPDVVVITGDLVDGTVPELAHAVSGFAGLRSRFGTHFVTGNHEYYSGDLSWAAYLRSLEVKVLRNERASIGDHGGSFDLVGVDDWSGARRSNRKGYDLEAALRGRDVERAAVLLAHQPEGFEDAIAAGVDLQISGHTHGGQIFPFSRLASLRFRHDRGWFRHEGGHLYVSRGCGFWGPPSRIDSPPELVSFELTRG